MSRNRFEKRRDAIDKSIRDKIDEYKAIYKKADEEDRDPTDEERLDIESHLKAIETLKEERENVDANIKTLEDVDRIRDKIGPAVEPADVRVVSEPADRVAQYAQKSLGKMFVESAGYKNALAAYKEHGRLPSNFTTGAVSFESKAGTLFEGAAGQGAGLIPVPQVIPGVVEKLFQPLRVADLLMSGQTTTNSLRYVVEGTATNSAAAVAEGGTKPASDLALSTKDEPVKKLATVLTVSDEMLEDAPQVESYINGRLSLFVRQAEEASIVSGAGTDDLVGLLNSGRNINTYAAGTVDNGAVAIFKAMNGQRGSAFLEPDFIVLNPANWQTLRLLTDTAGQFFGGGPWQGQYGAGAMASPTGPQIQGPNDYLWQKPVVVTTAIGAGTALIGTSAAAQVWRRGGVTVEATNSHASYFTSNLVAIRAEERLALAVYRPAAFTKITGLT